MASDNGADRRRGDYPHSSTGRPKSSAAGRRGSSSTTAQPGSVRPASTAYSASRSAHRSADRSHSASSSRYSRSDYSTSPAEQFSRHSASYVSTGGSSKKRRVVVIILILLLVAAAVAIGLFIAKEMRKSAINSDLHGKWDDAQLEALDGVLTGSQVFDEPFVVLLIGTDRSEDREGTLEYGDVFRSDTNILMRVDPVNNAVSLLSIQRDTMIELDGVGTAKFNAAYSYGGAAGTIAAVKDLTGVDVDHYAEVDFEGLEGLIDAVGGIDVYVPEEINDHDAGGHVDQGQQHLNGSQALVFARSRAYADGDYTRATNQRTILEALAHKLLETPASELAGVIQASTAFLTTDPGMDFDFIYSVADQMRHNADHPTIDIYSANLPSQAAMVGDVSYVIADTAGVADMIEAFMAGKDIGKVEVSSSIDEDLAAANATLGAGLDYYGYGYGYDTGYDYGYGTGTGDDVYYDYGTGDATGGDVYYDSGTTDAMGGDVYYDYGTGDATGGDVYYDYDAAA